MQLVVGCCTGSKLAAAQSLLDAEDDDEAAVAGGGGGWGDDEDLDIDEGDYVIVCALPKLNLSFLCTYFELHHTITCHQIFMSTL